MRNSDMTEGRGPMVMDSVWLDKQKANDYIDKQQGIMGRKLKWSEEDYGDWRVEMWETIDSMIQLGSRKSGLRVSDLCKP